MSTPMFIEKKVTEKSATVLIKNVRLQWVRLASPDTTYANTDDHGNPLDGMFGVSMLIPKKSAKKFLTDMEKTLTGFSRQVKTFKNAKESEKALKTALKTGNEGALLKDGDNMIKEETGLPYEGNAEMYLMRAKTKGVRNAEGVIEPRFPIKLVRADKSPIVKDDITEELYSGVHANVLVNISPYKSGNNIGYTVYLNQVQKLRDDTPLSGADYFDDESESEESDDESELDED